eukprot:CAMPEP_0115417358 /NCGR_PEP_ID=MMETSP0271-20121206/24084_1 /TAXON_ID=71861 /ORGANISM="Scrippsiella trochoidea, Strain CCMP3099" /LENGTH=520 /DNA_ID=CAMNT_0002841745 /DNA_START=54 /DNA_END=1613 /DNA_ORIENTATION=+
MAEENDEEDLVLPEREFTYVAGSQDRPWSHFTGRWRAMRPYLAKMLQASGSDRPLRVVDLGSCTGFFSLQAAFRHPEADVIAVEGSVGIGNGTTGMAGSARQILSTGAVSTHLRWIQRLRLPNCFVAPEVWDYARICELASQGRPICDVMFMLSVVHHIDNISVQQYTRAGLSRLDGVVDLLGKLLLLAPRHFVELPNRPWMAAAYDAYSTQRAILEAAAAASGREWQFKGPISTAEWFGLRELWVLEVQSAMPPLDLQTCPFFLLYRGEEQELNEPPDDPLNDLGSLDAYGDPGMHLGGPASFDAGGAVDACGGSGGNRCGQGGGLLDSAVGAGSGFADPFVEASALGLLPGMEGNAANALAALTSCQALGGTLVDPGLMVLSSGPCGSVDATVAEAVTSAPTELLLAHLTLREAMTEAEDLLREVRSANLAEEQAQQQQQPQPQSDPSLRQQQYTAPRQTLVPAAGAVRRPQDVVGSARSQLVTAPVVVRQHQQPPQRGAGMVGAYGQQQQQQQQQQQ